MTGSELLQLIERRPVVDPAVVTEALDEHVALVHVLWPEGGEAAADELTAALALRRRRAIWLVRWELASHATVLAGRTSAAVALIAAAVRLAG
jgi:hypothetical protein